MIDTLAGPGTGEADALTASDLLASIRASRDLENTEAARQLDLAARWADLHPPESIHSAAAFTVPGSDHEEPLAGEGCPLVAEFCIAELGTVLGISSTSAKKLIGHALELRHRLPRLWSQVQSGHVPAWRARSVAETTIHSTPSLTREAAAFVDAQVAAVAGRIGPAQLDRLVAETVKRYDLAAVDPAADPEDGYLSVDPRHATLHDDDVHFAGTMRFEAELDIADGLDLDRALAQKAAEQKALGSAESLDVRRAKALGDLARTQTALDLSAQGGRVAGDSAPGGRVAGEERAGVSRPDLPAAREVVLHAHFDASVVGEQTVFGPTGRMEERQRLILLDQIRRLVRRLADQGHDQAGHRPQRPPDSTGLRHPRPHPRTSHPARPHLRVPVVHETGSRLRRRPRHPLRPRRRRRGPTTNRCHDDVEPRRPLQVPPPPQDPHGLALPRHRTRCVRVDQPPRPPLPTRHHRHHPDRRRRPGPTRHPTTPPTMTPPHTPPQHHPAGPQARDGSAPQPSRRSSASSSSRQRFRSSRDSRS